MKVYQGDLQQLGDSVFRVQGDLLQLGAGKAHGSHEPLSLSLSHTPSTHGYRGSRQAGKTFTWFRGRGWGLGSGDLLQLGAGSAHGSHEPLTHLHPNLLLTCQ